MMRQQKPVARFAGIVLTILLCACILSACSISDIGDFLSELEKTLSEMSNESNPADISEESDSSSASDVSDQPPAYTVSFDENEQFATEAEKQASEIIDSAIAEAVEGINIALRHKDIPDVEIPELVKKERRRDSLDEFDGQLYDEMKAAIENYEDFSYNPYDYGCTSPFDSRFVSSLLTARDALYWDETRLFMYCDLGTESQLNVSCYYMPNDWMKKCEDKKAIKEAVDVFDKVCERIFKKMPEGLSATLKVYYFARVIASVTSYDDSMESRSAMFQPYECLVKKSCVCQGYARALQYLCKLAGIESVSCVSGEAPGGGPHMWNKVETANGPYYIDVTWADVENESGGWFRDFYFLMDEDTLLHAEGYIITQESDY